METRTESLKGGEKVLILLPTDSSKLLMQWKGPYEILESVNPYDYRVNVDGKEKVYHAHLLKKYVERNVD